MNLTRIAKSLLGLITTSMAFASDAVQVDIAPYLWATSMQGTVQIGPERVSISQSFFDLMKHFEGGGMLFVDIHKNRWGLFGNGLYSVLKDTHRFDHIPIGARNNFGIISGGLSYALVSKPVYDAPNPDLSIELLAGARATFNDTKLTIGPFSFRDNKSWTDPIFGARVTLPLKPRFHFIAEGDGGKANSHHSYNAQAFLGYQPVKPLFFNNVTLYLGYRYLHQYFATGSKLRYFLWDMDIKGPVLGFKATF
ncbi:hypothetical protein [Legionella feeleii]|uniref:Outer membrane protein n=1 Tax=Legionella feeleii TaxID=453 RepID=A0A0W0TEL8_9GAMM|nr:hypothetical protein [Legionella feeleii]KTC94031.1 hypothetical protein Lfee_3268 [Legionella feeleii]SPX61953.1 outer membrane protein [Legionella feeleii]